MTSICHNCGDHFDAPERECPEPSPGIPYVDCGRGGHYFIDRPESCNPGLNTASTQLRPMSAAPITGPVAEILVATTDRAGCNGWLIVHYAGGGGEDQPRFRGWFFWTGFDFREIDGKSLLGWLPLPVMRP